jgi:hypothetical protein
VSRAPRRLRRVLALVLAAPGLGCSSDAASTAGLRPDPPPPPAETRDGRWVQDVDYLAGQLTRLHPNLFFRTPRADFERLVDELRRSVPSLEDDEIAVGLLRIAAAPGDAHTSLSFSPAFRRLPLRLARFSDGLHVIAAEAALASVLGTRVVAIGERTAAEAEAAVTPLVSHENAAWLAVRAPSFLVIPEVLRAVGVARDASLVPLVLEDGSGARFRSTVAAVVQPGPELLDLTVAAGFRLPLHRRRQGEDYWFSLLEETGTLYLQYNRCRNGPEAFANLAQRLFRDLDQQAVARLVIDVRHNPGGDSSVDDPLIRGLESRPSWRAGKRLFCLIGGETFSSGVWTANDLRRLGATLVGSPTGGKPNSYGNVRSFLLPSSRLEAFYSTTFYRIIDDADPPSLIPDVPVDPTLADYREGRDPLLDAVLRASPAP